MVIMSKGRVFFLALAIFCICIRTQSASASTGANEIVFIDAAVQDAKVLLDGLPPGIESVQLKADRDGVLQIGEFLEQKRGFSAIHVISHAGPGRVFLGTGMLSTDTLEKYRKPLQAIATSLVKNGEILLYGCDVAKGKAGEIFVEALTKATGANVAASVDRTGPESLGGNGTLEFSTGSITSRVLAGFDRYPHTLADITYTFDSDTQGWTGGMWHTAFPGQFFQGSGDAELSFYPPSARYVQTMQVHSYLGTGQSFHMYVMYKGLVKYSATVTNSTSWSTHTINQNVDRIRFVNDIGGGNGWFYPGVDNVVTSDAAGNSAPTVTGSSSASITTAQTATPFSTLAVADANADNVSLTITYPAANGTLTGAGLSGSAGSYTMSSAVPATIQTQLRALVFTPTEGQVTLGNSVSTTFTITPNDGTVSGAANTGCQVVATATYPKVTINNSTDNLYAYIANVSIGTINNTSTYTSTDNQAAYTDYSATLNTNVWRGATQNISVTLGGSYVAGQTIAAFFDWNKDGDFSDANETVPIVTKASGGTTGAGPYSISFTVPATAASGATRMRVVTDYDRDPLTSGNIEYGEAEDYTITVNPAPTPATGSATDISVTGATLNGTVNDNGVAVTSIYFDYGTAAPAYGSTKAGTPATLSAGAGSTSITGEITGLACGSTYHFRVNAVHSGGAIYGGDQTFTTGACNTTPTLAHNTGLTLNQNAGQTIITNTLLQATDAEQAASALTFTIGTVPAKGTLKKSGTALVATNTFTQDDIDNSRITYTPATNEFGADSFTFIVNDGAGGNTGSTTFAITIVDATAPTATISYSPAGPYTKGASVTITADFSEAIADSPAMQIAISAITGGSALPAANMTKSSSTSYTYSYTVGDGNGTANVTLATGKDLAGNLVTATPTSGGSFTVNKSASSVTLGSSGATSTYGDSITLTATVTSGATGTVDFKDGATSITGCSAVAVSGVTATCATTALLAGSRAVTAAYGGDNTYNSSTSSTFTQTVNQASLNVTADAKTKVYGVADPVFTYTHSGLTNGDTVSLFTGALARDPGASPGDYNITQGTLSAGANYAITFTGAKLTIVTSGLSGIIVNPDTPQNLVAGLFGAGIMRSSDSGATWTAATGQPGNQGIKALVMHPVSHATFFAASYGGGIYTSTDSGDTWNACGGQPGNMNVLSLAIDPAGILYAGTEGGIFTSSTCAVWSAVNSGLTVDATKPPVAIAIDTTTPANLYAGLDGAGVFKSTDGGGSWTAATTQPASLRVKALVIKPGDSEKLFAATYGGGVFKSENSGVDWSACAANPANLNLVSLTIDATGKLYAGTEAGVFVSADACATWMAMNSGLP